MHLPPPDPVESILEEPCFAVVQEKGDCYASMGQYEPAQQYYERAATLEPDDPRPYVGLGVIGIQQERWEDADTAFRVALRLDAQCSRAYTGLAMIAEQRQEHRKAFDCYLKSLECDPDNLTALLGLFQASCRMGSFRQVIYYLDLYLQSHPQDTSVMFSLAALYVKDGSLIKAKRMLQELIVLTPDNHEAVNLLEEVEHSLTREVATQHIAPLPQRRLARTRIA